MRTPEQARTTLRLFNKLPVPRGLDRRRFLIILGLTSATLRMLERDAMAAVSYFGLCDVNGVPTVNPPVDNQFLGSLTLRNKNYTTGFSCPGTGDQNVVSLSVWCKAVVGGLHNIRCSVYDLVTSIYNLVCQHSVEVSVASTSAGWVGRSQAIAWYGTYTKLVGGRTYYLAFSADDAAGDEIIYYMIGAQTAGDYMYTLTDYTGGYPATLADDVNYDRHFFISCGTEPFASAARPNGMLLRGVR